MSQLGTVSAVIPSFNYGRFVADAVESVLAQDYEPGLEIIVVDDGSTDDTRERLLPFAGRVRTIHLSNRGPAAARNAGIRAADGDWVAFLDADDIWHSAKTSVHLRAAAEHGLDVVGSPRCLLPKGPVSKAMRTPMSADPIVRRVETLDLLMGTPIHSSSTIARRSTFEVVGMFDESLRWSEDRDMWLRLGARFAVGSLDGPCAFYRQHGAQSSRNAPQMMESFERVLARFFAAHPEHAALQKLAYSFLYLDAGIAHMEAGARRDAARFLLRSLQIHAWEPTSRHACLSSVLRLKLLARTLLGEELFASVWKRARA